MLDPINWFEVPYNHKWEKTYTSIMNPSGKVTWPQYLSECVIWVRTQRIKKYKDIQRGPGWSNQIQRDVRALNQQAAVICNFFPNPKEDPLVEVAFKNFFRRVQPITIGGFRKVRSYMKNGRQVSNITQNEKDIITGVMTEYNKLKEQREVFKQIAPKQEPVKPPEAIKFNTTGSANKTKKNLSSLLELENKLRGKDGERDAEKS